MHSWRDGWDNVAMQGWFIFYFMEGGGYDSGVEMETGCEGVTIAFTL